MIIESIKFELKNHIKKNDIIKIGYIKEFLQTIILGQIYSLDYAKDLIFYGGTSLRFLFGINRLSEDLDFIGINFLEFDKLGEDLQNYFSNNNIKLNYKIQKFRIILNFKDLLKEFGIKYQNSHDLYIKIEISDNFNFCKGFKTKLYPIFKYNQSLIIKSLDKETIFSTKLNAVLYRNWEKQIGANKISVKGRDIYDLFWYLSNNTKPNINCIEGIENIGMLKDKLVEIISKINFKEVILDVENFLEDKNMLSFMQEYGKEYILEKINEW
ncbi:MAG: nucleotidyl transferase AbiEii/AbiGii toxin family protein [Candidatus Gracilibacteria bacterium]|nr:nucleotidyl transferase AbiEii/AbiGii toxin family protein [Candidatus Gracilibacteria bacterium]